MYIYQYFKGKLSKCSAVVLLAIPCFPALAQISDEAMHNSVVRIEVEQGPVISMASGFVWQQKNLVITSLHAIRRKPATITVVCRDVPYRASVERVLRDADLVLLKTNEALQNCSPINAINPIKPSSKSPLTAFGFKPDVTASTTKDLKKASASSEKLKSLITGDMKVPMQRLNMPSLDLPVYFVTGGIYKGYSGGPVLDNNGFLVGIVEGGLDKGLSDHNWLIPATNIERLMASAQVDDIPADLNDQEYFFSAVLTKRSAPDNYIVFEDSNNSYRWIKTKTRTFEQLRQTSAAADGLEELWQTMLPDIETAAERNLAFDIYEEEQLGIVIAIPAGRKLKHIEEQGDWSLVATDSLDEQAFIKVRHGAYQYADEKGTAIPASHEDFFDYAIDEDLACEPPVTCEMKEDHFRVVNYGEGNFIFRAGYQEDNSSDNMSAYRYINRVIRGDDVLIVETLLNLGADSAINKCFDDTSPENCGKAFWEPASFMLAAALTNFSNLSVEGIKPVVYTPKDETCDDCDDKPASSSSQATVPVDPSSLLYVNENSELVFFQFADDSWFINMPGEPEQAEVLGRETFTDGLEYVILAYQDFLYAVPIEGGVYQVAQAGGEWSAVNKLIPQLSE